MKKSDTTAYEHASAMEFAKLLTALPLDSQLEIRKTMEAKRSTLSEDTVPTMYRWCCEFLAVMAYLYSMHPEALEQAKHCARVCKKADAWALKHADNSNSVAAMQDLERLERNVTPERTFRNIGTAVISVILSLSLAFMMFQRF